MSSINFKVSRSDINKAIFGILEGCYKSSTVFIRRANKVVGKIRASAIRNNDWGNVRLTIGKLNYRERAFHKLHPDKNIQQISAKN